MRHKLHIRAFFRKDSEHRQAKVYDPPVEPDRVLDTEHNEIVPPEGLSRKPLKKRLFRAMIKGWKSFTPYS